MDLNKIHVNIGFILIMVILDDFLIISLAKLVKIQIGMYYMF